MVDRIELTKCFLNIAAAPLSALSLANGIDEVSAAKSTHNLARTALSLSLASTSYLAAKGRIHSASLSSHIPSLRGHAQVFATLASAAVATSLLLIPAILGAVRLMSAERGYLRLAKCCSILIKMLITMNKIIACALAIFGLLIATSIRMPSLIAFYLLLAALNLACTMNHLALQKTKVGRL